MDTLSWDLGNPQGQVKIFNQNCNFGLPGCENWHPMKGPMATQTLVGIIGDEPFHWRGDRDDLPEFNGAFIGLMGDDTMLTPSQMDEFVSFIETITPPPNPFRNINGSLPSSFPNGGNPQTGQNLFNTVPFDGGVFTCVFCHALPTGTNGVIISGNLLQEAQSMKIPQLRNLYEKTGFAPGSQTNSRGFGFVHDGSIPTLFQFLQFPGFNFAAGAAGNQQRRDVEAFLMCFATDTHAAVGVQATLPGTGAPGQPATVGDLAALAGGGTVGLVVKGRLEGEERGWYLTGPGMFQSDRIDETASLADLQSAAGPGSELTFTAVPAGSQERIGVDRDQDGFYDRDEIDAGSDPADPISTPENVGDLNGDGIVAVADLLVLLASWGPCPSPPGPCPADLDGDGSVGITDLLIQLGNWG
jgi:hypothetical protein